MIFSSARTLRVSLGLISWTYFTPGGDAAKKHAGLLCLFELSVYLLLDTHCASLSHNKHTSSLQTLEGSVFIVSLYLCLFHHRSVIDLHTLTCSSRASEDRGRKLLFKQVKVKSRSGHDSIYKANNHLATSHDDPIEIDRLSSPNLD